MRENAMPGEASQPDGLADIKTLPELLRWRVKATPAAEAYRHFDRAAQRWVSQSWREIDAAFASFAKDRPDALFSSPNPFFRSRRVQMR